MMMNMFAGYENKLFIINLMSNCCKRLDHDLLTEAKTNRSTTVYLHAC